MRPVRSVEPTRDQEPVSLQEARLQCSLPDAAGYHDQLLEGLVVAARQKLEFDTGVVCHTGTFTYKLTDWPCEWFELPLRPVTSITSIAYVDAAGTSQTLSTSVYAFEADAVIPFVRLKHGQSWPTLRGDINGITTTVVAGYSAVSAIPRQIKQAILLLVGHWFLHRETVLAGTISKEIEFSYSALIGGLMRSSYP